MARPDWRPLTTGLGVPQYESEMGKLATGLCCERVVFSRPLYGAIKSEAYLDAENFGMTVAEALAHGCPTVVSRGAPWSKLETEGFGWCVEHNMPNLTATPEAAMTDRIINSVWLDWNVHQKTHPPIGLGIEAE